MANVSFADINQTINTNNNYITPAAPFSGGAIGDFWAWVSDVNGTGNVINNGVGFTYSSGQTISGGTITRARVDPSEDINATDINITGLSLDAMLLAPLIGGGLTGDQQNNLYWRVVLSGDDVIDLGSSAFNISFAGDGVDVETDQFIVGGADTITGASNGGFISGDFFDIAVSATVIGGGDIIIKSDNGDVYGDASSVAGTLFGGDDFIITSGGNNAYGEAFGIESGGAIIGGDDTIVRQDAGFSFGEVNVVSMNEGLVAGDDTLIGSNGNDNLRGDVFLVDADALYFTGGDDMLVGGAGNDNLRGDWNSNNLAGAIGGNDSLFGGSGNDALYGNDGDDFLDGGSGTETVLDGGDGMDTISFLTATGGASVALYLATDQVADDGYGNTETLTSIESVVGSTFGDSIVGDGNNNVIQGEFGDDVIFAGFGNDFIVGGQGTDFLNGSEGFDAFAFDASDFTAGTFDIISDFSDNATSYDSLYLTSLTMADLTIADFGGDVYVYTTPTFDAGILIQGFTAAQLDDQIIFA